MTLGLAARRLPVHPPALRSLPPLRWMRSAPSRRRPPAAPAAGKSEWWAVDGEMHEIGEHVPHRERFVIPRDNLPNRRRKQMREQFMRSTRLVLKDSDEKRQFIALIGGRRPALPSRAAGPRRCP